MCRSHRMLAYPSGGNEWRLRLSAVIMTLGYKLSSGGEGSPGTPIYLLLFP